jgi:two-component system, cell cycle sensor histidine kinase and response regulator CckA
MKRNLVSVNLSAASSLTFLFRAEQSSYSFLTNIVVLHCHEWPVEAGIIVVAEIGFHGVTSAVFQTFLTRFRSYHTSHQTLGWLARIATLALAYFTSAKVGLMVSTIGNNVTLIWPPTGLAVFCLYHWGRKYWPGIALGAFAVNLTLSQFWVAAGIAIGNTLAPLLAVVLLRSLRFRSEYNSRTDVAVYTLCGAVLPMVLSAVNGVVWLQLAGVIDWNQIGQAFCVWWAGDAAGVMVFGPVFFGWPRQLIRWKRDGVPVGAIVWLLAITIVSLLVFSRLTSLGNQYWAIAFVPIMMLTLVNIVYRGWVAAVGVVINATIVVFGTASDAGPFSHASANTEVFQVFVYMVSVALITLLISSLLGEREKAEKELAIREAEYRGLVEDNPALILRFDRGGVLIFANDSYCRFIGTSRENAYGFAFSALAEGPSQNRMRDLFRKLRYEAGPFTFHGPFLDSTNTERWIEWKGRAEGDEIQMVGLDVTERHLAELERKRLDERVVQAQKMESLGAIAGGVAHDFNNLLTGVMGYTDLALASLPLDTPARPHLVAVTELARQAADLSRQLLAYAGKGQLLIHPIDLNTVAESTFQFGTKRLPSGISVKTRFCSELPQIRADESQVRQVLLNIVFNAVESFQQQVGEIELATGQTILNGNDIVEPGTGKYLPAGRYVWLRVQDTGSGISKELLPRIFDPFVTTKFQGRGLGLAAAQGVVRAHSGAIQVETSSAGTAFTLLFPASVDAPVPDPTSMPIVLKAPHFANPQCVLIVDDEEVLRDMTAQMIRQLGWEVQTVNNGSDAVELFNSNPNAYRIVILDLTMPKMNGWQAVEQMRRTHPGLPVILCIGLNQDSIPNTDPKITSVLLKPFRKHELEQCLRQLLASQ